MPEKFLLNATVFSNNDFLSSFDELIEYQEGLIFPNAEVIVGLMVLFQKFENCRYICTDELLTAHMSG